MFAVPLRYCSQMKHMHCVLSISNNNIAQVVAGIGRGYASDKGSCCKEITQTKGKTVEPWPKNDSPPPAWRFECPGETQPPNYDPYKIKVPDVVVPPMPPSNAKELPSEDARELFRNPEASFGKVTASQVRDLFHNSPIVHPDYWRDRPERKLSDIVKETLPKLGYHGRNKYKYAFHEPWRPLDRLALLEQAERDELERIDEPMMDCSKQRGPCSLKLVPDPPPCPPPPPPPFPWIYVWVLGSFCSIMGMIYKLYLWKEERDRISENVPIWRPRRKMKRPAHDKDLPPCVQYLIVGTGAAGWAAYRAIMEHDKTAKVFFVTKEDILPYIRPPMSKFMWWNPDPPDLKKLNYVEEGRRKTLYLADCPKFMDPVKFYRKKTGPAVSIASGWCVVRVDADEHVVYVRTTCGEQPIYYERCLLAPGSKAKNLNLFNSAPKAVRDKVHTLRTIRDLEISYRKVKEAKHVVILGGGILGTELAWHLGRMNQVVERPEDKEPIQFTFMYKDRGILASIIPDYLGEWAAEKVKCEGVTLMPQTQVYDAFETPDGRLELTLSNGKSLVTDYVLVAIGGTPREELAEPSFLELDRINGGFKVNTELKARTHLYVAGDAASFYSQWKDTRLRFEHYLNAEEQGFVAGANMTGYWTPCNMEPAYSLRLGHVLDMEVVGEVGACMPTIGVFKQCAEEALEQAAANIPPKQEPGAGEHPCYKKSLEYKNRYKRGIMFYLRDETIVGMLFWNIPPVDDRKDVVTEMLRARPSYKDINMLAELLGFPESQCTPPLAEELVEIGPCIKNWRVF